jgi:hypothetical protein
MLFPNHPPHENNTTDANRCIYMKASSQEASQDELDTFVLLE